MASEVKTYDSDVVPSSRELVNIFKENLKSPPLSLNQCPPDKSAPFSIKKSNLSKREFEIKLIDERRKSFESFKDDQTSLEKVDKSHDLHVKYTSRIICVKDDSSSRVEPDLCQPVKKSRHSNPERDTAGKCLFSLDSKGPECHAPRQHKTRLGPKENKHSPKNEERHRGLSHRRREHSRPQCKSKHHHESSSPRADKPQKGNAPLLTSKVKSTPDPISILKDKKERLRVYLKSESSDGKEGSKRSSTTSSKNERNCKFCEEKKYSKLNKRYSFEEILAEASNKLYAHIKSRNKLRKNKLKPEFDKAKSNRKKIGKSYARPKIEERHRRSRNFNEPKLKHVKESKICKNRDKYKLMEDKKDPSIANALRSKHDTVCYDSTSIKNRESLISCKENTQEPLVMLERLEKHLAYPYIKQLNRNGSLRVPSSKYNSAFDSEISNSETAKVNDNTNLKESQRNSMEPTKETLIIDDGITIKKNHESTGKKKGTTLLLNPHAGRKLKDSKSLDLCGDSDTTPSEVANTTVDVQKQTGFCGMNYSPVSTAKIPREESDEEFLDRLSNGKPPTLVEESQNHTSETKRAYNLTCSETPAKNTSSCLSTKSKPEMIEPKIREHVIHGEDPSRGQLSFTTETPKLDNTHQEDAGVPKLVLYLTGAGPDKHYACSSNIKDSDTNTDRHLKKRKLKVKELDEVPKYEKRGSKSEKDFPFAVDSKLNEQVRKNVHSSLSSSHDQSKSPIPSDTSNAYYAVNDLNPLRKVIEKVIDETVKANSTSNGKNNNYLILQPKSKAFDYRPKSLPDLKPQSNQEENRHRRNSTEKNSNSLKKKTFSHPSLTGKPTAHVEPYNTDLELRVRYRRGRGFYDETVPLFDHEEESAKKKSTLKSEQTSKEIAPLVDYKETQERASPNLLNGKKNLDAFVTEVKTPTETQTKISNSPKDESSFRLNNTSKLKSAPTLSSHNSSPYHVDDLAIIESDPNPITSFSSLKYKEAKGNEVASTSTEPPDDEDRTRHSVLSSPATEIKRCGVIRRNESYNSNFKKLKRIRKRSLSLDSSVVSEPTGGYSFAKLSTKPKSSSLTKLDTGTTTEPEKNFPIKGKLDIVGVLPHITEFSDTQKRVALPMVQLTGQASEANTNQVSQAIQDPKQVPNSEMDRGVHWTCEEESLFTPKRSTSELDSDHQGKDKTTQKANESPDSFRSDTKKRKKEKRKASREDENQTVAEALDKQRHIFHEQARGRRLALEIPRFNWLEEKILNNNASVTSYTTQTGSTNSAGSPCPLNDPVRAPARKSCTPPSSPVGSKAEASPVKTSRSLSLPTDAMRGNMKPLPALIPSSDFIASKSSSNSSSSSTNSSSLPVTSNPSIEPPQTDTEVIRRSLDKMDPPTPTHHPPADQNHPVSPPPPATKRSNFEATESNGLLQIKRCHLQTAVPPLIATSKVTPLPKRKISPPSLHSGQIPQHHSSTSSPPSLTPLPCGGDAAASDLAPAAAQGSTQSCSVSSTNLTETDGHSEGSTVDSPPREMDSLEKSVAEFDSSGRDQEEASSKSSPEESLKEGSLDEPTNNESEGNKSSDNSPEVPVSQKLSILTEAFKKKLNTIMDSPESASPLSPAEDRQPTSLKLEGDSEAKSPQNSKSTIMTSSKVENSSPNTSPSVDVKKCASPEVNSSNCDDQSKITSSLSTEEESPVLISIPETLPSFESVLCNIKMSDSLHQNVFGLDKKSSEPSLIAALYEELMRTRQEVEKLRKVQEQMLNAEKKKEEEVDLSKVKEEKVEGEKPTPLLIDLSEIEDKESQVPTKATSNVVEKEKDSKATSDSNIKFVYEVKEGEKRSMQQGPSQSSKRLKQETSEPEQNIITIRYTLPPNSEGDPPQNTIETKEKEKLRSMLGIVNNDLDVVPVVDKSNSQLIKDLSDNQTSIITSSTKEAMEKRQNLETPIDKPELVRLLSSTHSRHPRLSMPEPPSLISSTQQPTSLRRNSDPNESLQMRHKSIPRMAYSQPNENNGPILKRSLTDKPKSYTNISPAPPDNTGTKINVISVPEPQTMTYGHSSVPIVKYQQAPSFTHPSSFSYPEEEKRKLVPPRTHQMSAHAQQAHEAYMNDKMKEMHGPQTFHPKILIHSSGKRMIPPSDWHPGQYQGRMNEPPRPPPGPMGPRVIQSPIRMPLSRPNMSQAPSFHPSTSKMAEIFPIPKVLSPNSMRNQSVASIHHQESALPQNYKPGEHVSHNPSRNTGGYPISSHGGSIYPPQPPPPHAPPPVSNLSMHGNSQQAVPPISPQCPISVPNMPSHNSQITPRLSPNDAITPLNPKKSVVYLPQPQRSYPYHSEPSPQPPQRVTPPHEVNPLHRLTPPHKASYQQPLVNSSNCPQQAPHVSPPARQAQSPSYIGRSQHQQMVPFPPYPTKSFSQPPDQGAVPFPQQQRSPHQHPIRSPGHQYNRMPSPKLNTSIRLQHPHSMQQPPPHVPPMSQPQPRYELHTTSVALPAAAVHQGSGGYEHKIVRAQNQSSSASESPEHQHNGKTKKTCLVCRQPAQFLCSGCKMAWYCHKDCQRDHWPIHSPDCQSRK